MSLLFLLTSLGVINGLLVGVFLIIRNQNKVANAYLGGMLLALSLRIGKSVLFYFNKEVDLLILQIGLSACLFIGPFFFMYAKALRFQTKKFPSTDKTLLLLLLIGILVSGIVFPYRTNPDIWNGYIAYFIYGVWGAFSLLGLFQAFQELRPVILTPRLMSRSQQNLTVIVIAVLLINLTYQMSWFVGFTYMWGSLIFSFTMYFLLGRALASSKAFGHKSTDQPLEGAEQILQKLNQLMNDEKPYLNSKLKLDDLAKNTDLPKHTLSKLLNEEYKYGFAQYIKEYRVTEAKALINARPELTLEGIGYEAGFSSKSSFFDAFKKITNKTPSEYLKSLQSVDSKA